MGILLLATVRAESGPQNLPCSQSYFSSSEKCNLTHSTKILGQFFTSYTQATLYFITERKTLPPPTPPQISKIIGKQQQQKALAAKRDYLMNLCICVCTGARMCAYIYDRMDNYH